LNYLKDLLAAIQGGFHLGLLRAGFELAFSTAESLGVPISDVAPSLVQLAKLLDERKTKQPLKD
jgi:hypothetical protein